MWNLGKEHFKQRQRITKVMRQMSAWHFQGRGGRPAWLKENEGWECGSGGPGGSGSIRPVDHEKSAWA